jgi:hypothetical protein
MGVAVVVLSCCYVPHWYACLYAAGLAEYVPFLIINIIVIQELKKLSDFVERGSLPCSGSWNIGPESRHFVANCNSIIWQRL